MIDASLIKKLVHGSLSGTIPFPEIIQQLAQAGIESYHVDYLSAVQRFYHSNGETYTEKLEFNFPKVAESFSPEKLQATIKKSQAGLAKFPEFLEASATVGCVYYIVSIRGKLVRYFGRDGAEHLEPFPNSR